MKPQTFRPCPIITIGFSAGFAGLAALFWWLMKEGEIALWAGWSWAIFFGFLAIMFPLLTILGKHSLKLYGEGFTLRGLFGQHRYRWENVHSIRVAEFGHGGKFVSVEIEKNELRVAEFRSTFNLSISTALFLVTPSDLASMMNAWREAALGIDFADRSHAHQSDTALMGLN